MLTCAPQPKPGEVGVTGTRMEMNGNEWKNLTCGAKRGLLYLKPFQFRTKAACVCARVHVCVFVCVLATWPPEQVGQLPKGMSFFFFTCSHASFSIEGKWSSESWSVRTRFNVKKEWIQGHFTQNAKLTSHPAVHPL